VDLLLGDFRERLHGLGIEMKLSDSAREFIAKEGYDPVYGARPLKRFIQREIETPVARRLIKGDLAAGRAVKITVKDGAVRVE
jgi:ATP-dependent Clp protease ATP-binding subunit ClpB